MTNSGKHRELKKSVAIMLALLLTFSGFIPAFANVEGGENQQTVTEAVYENDGGNDHNDPVYTEEWDGRGKDSLECEKLGESPERTEDGWIHWVFNTKGSSTDAELVLSGSGSGTYEPGEPLNANVWHFYTPYVDVDELEATIYLNGEPGSGGGLVISDYCPGTSEEEITPVQPLQLTSVCSDKRGEVKFRVTNQNEFDVDFTFENVDNGATGNGTAPAAEEGSESYFYFYVDADENSPNTTKLEWLDENEEMQSTTKASGNLICQYEVKVVKEWVDANENMMDEAPEDLEWEVTITTSGGEEYTLDNENSSIIFELEFDETFEIDEDVPEGFMVLGTGTFDRDDAYPDGPPWEFKGEEKYYGEGDDKEGLGTLIVQNIEESSTEDDPVVEEDDPVVEEDDPVVEEDDPTISTGGGGRPLPEPSFEIEPFTVPEGVPEPEVIVPETEVPEGTPEPDETIFLDEEPPLGAPELPQTGEGNPIYFYLAGLLLAGTGLALRKRTGNAVKS